jgi:hypothetical protein
MGVYLSGLAILRRMSINQVMREACLPVEYVGVPLIQPQVSSRLVISPIFLKTEQIRSRKLRLNTPSEPKDFRACGDEGRRLQRNQLTTCACGQPNPEPRVRGEVVIP